MSKWHELKEDDYPRHLQDIILKDDDADINMCFYHFLKEVFYDHAGYVVQVRQPAKWIYLYDAMEILEDA